MTEHSGVEEYREAYTVTNIRDVFAKVARVDEQGVPMLNEADLIAALRAGAGETP